MNVKNLLAVIIFALFAACAGQNPVGEPTIKVELVKPSGFLKDYSLLKKGGEERMNLVYVNPETNFADYNKIMVDPVTIWFSPESNLSKIPPKDRQELANELHDVREEKKITWTKFFVS